MNSALDFAFPAKSSFVCGVRRLIPSPALGYRVRLCSLHPSSSLKFCFVGNGVAETHDLVSKFGFFKKHLYMYIRVIEKENPISSEREEIIEEPVGLTMSEREIGDNQRCTCCQAKGALLCATCTGTGLYVDSIMESQGIIVKVRCLGCGGTGNTMCKSCGGRGHVGH